MKRSYELEDRYGEVKAQAADVITENIEPTASVKTKSVVIREPARLNSDKAYVELAKNEEIQ